MSTTLLEIVQGIMSDMDADEVNSIADTTESEQVARIVVQTFKNMVANSTWANSRRLIELTASGNNTIPTHMYLPENVKELIAINYDKRTTPAGKKAYDECMYKYPDDFLRLVNSRDSSSVNVETIIDPTGVELLITNNAAPTYYTSFDDTTIVFDSYNKAVDSTLQAVKTQCLAYIYPTITMADGTIIDLPDDAIPALVEEATSRAQFKLRQFQDVKSEAESGKQQRWLSRKSWRAHAQQRYPDYGRKGAGFGRDPTFKQDR